MGFFYVLFFIALVTVVVFVIMSKNDPPTGTQRELSQKMYGEPAKPQPSDDELLRDAALMMQKIEAMIQADETGRADIRQQLESETYTGPLPERRNDGGWTSIFDDLRILSIAGINHSQGINRYTGRNTVALVPEPQNEFDANAIKVLAEDGHHLGYIRREQTEMVRSWARDEFPMYCTCHIEEREDDDDGHRFYVGFLYVKLKK
jgi:hypothetical protein